MQLTQLLSLAGLGEGKVWIQMKNDTKRGRERENAGSTGSYQVPVDLLPSTNHKYSVTKKGTSVPLIFFPDWIYTKPQKQRTRIYLYMPEEVIQGSEQCQISACGQSCSITCSLIHVFTEHLPTQSVEENQARKE